MESDHKGTIYSVDWAPTAADAAAAIAAAKKVDTLIPEGISGGHDSGGLGAACLATGAADNSLRVFYERGEGDGAAFALDVEVCSNCWLIIVHIFYSSICRRILVWHCIWCSEFI